MLYATKHRRIQWVSPMSDVLAYPIDEAAKVVGVSRDRLYQAVRDNELTARKAGRATLVLRSDLEAWLQLLPTRGKPMEAVR
jgi:excisionase family DNA binding protein